MEAVNKYFIDVVKNQYFDFKGRTSRKFFWMFFLFNVILQTVVMIVAGMLGGMLNSPGIAMGLTLIVGLALLLPALGNSVRRMHDINKSGWWVLVSIVPIVQFAFIYFCVLPGDKESNNFGAVPAQD